MTRLVRGGHGLASEVHCQPVSRRCRHVAHHGRDHFWLEHDGQDTVLATIVVEDVCEARRNDTAKTLLEKRTRSMFTRRSAAEIVASQENRRALKARLI